MRTSAILNINGTNKAYGSSKLRKLIQRIKAMTQKATTGSPLAVTATVLAAVGILYGVAKDTVLFSSSQHTRLAIIEKVEADRKTAEDKDAREAKEWRGEVLKVLKEQQQTNKAALEIQRLILPYIPMPSFKRKEASDKIDKALNGRINEPYANGDIQPPGE